MPGGGWRLAGARAAGHTLLTGRLSLCVRALTARARVRCFRWLFQKHTLHTHSTHCTSSLGSRGVSREARTRACMLTSPPPLVCMRCCCGNAVAQGRLGAPPACHAAGPYPSPMTPVFCVTGRRHRARGGGNSAVLRLQNSCIATRFFSCTSGVLRSRAHFRSNRAAAQALGRPFSGKRALQ